MLRLNDTTWRTLCSVLALLITVSPLAAFAQTTNRREGQADAETTGRVARLAKRFDELKDLTESEREWMEACRHNCQAAAPGVREGAEMSEVDRKKAMSAVASQIHREIDAYIARTVRPDHVDPAAVGRSLKRVLGENEIGPLSAFVTTVNGKPSLVVAYTLDQRRMGPGGTSVTVRVYAVAQGSLRLAADTGDDMDGYANVELVQLHSPIPGELWVLLSGYMTGANGPNNEMRVYAYGGTGFREVWGPYDTWGTFAVQVTATGFSVDGDYYTAASGESRPARHDLYLLAEDGVRRVFP